MLKTCVKCHYSSFISNRFDGDDVDGRAKNKMSVFMFKQSRKPDLRKRGAKKGGQIINSSCKRQREAGLKMQAECYHMKLNYSGTELPPGNGRCSVSYSTSFVGSTLNPRLTSL